MPKTGLRQTYILRVTYGKTTTTTDTANRRRFLNQTGRINWQTIEKNGGSVYLRCSDGHRIDHRGKSVIFDNEADCTNKKDFDLCLTAFLEDQTVDTV